MILWCIIQQQLFQQVGMDDDLCVTVEASASTILKRLIP